MTKVLICKSLEEVANSLVTMAKLTAEHSKDWENYREIVLSTLRKVMEMKQ